MPQHPSSGESGYTRPGRSGRERGSDVTRYLTQRNADQDVTGYSPSSH